MPVFHVFQAANAVSCVVDKRSVQGSYRCVLHIFLL